MRGFQSGTTPGGVSDALLVNQRLNVGTICDVWRWRVGAGAALEGWEKIERFGAKKLALTRPLLRVCCDSCLLSGIVSNYTGRLWNTGQVLGTVPSTLHTVFRLISRTTCEESPPGNRQRNFIR
uniref:Uncharacterized protein n=1 Tax=Molossus molossus TaxID=27622 RepID=A0A7J8EEG7_MOLMO|nr:hypothetical protein HJG59_008830 [Molossus molossus]